MRMSSQLFYPVIIMKRTQNLELDDFLVNLMKAQSQKKPKLKQAIRYRKMNAVLGNSMKRIEQQKSIFDLSVFKKYGTGVTLFFHLLQLLIIVFTVLTLNALPSIICNLKGNGLDMYGPKTFTKSIMRISLANQNHYDMGQLNEDEHRIFDMKISQALLIFSDILSTVIFLSFLIFWHIKSDRLVHQLVSQNVFPSSYTLKIGNLPSEQYNQNEIKVQFQQFGKVAQISTVYETGDLYLDIQKFQKLVDQYSVEKDQSEKIRLYGILQEKYQKLKSDYIQKYVENRRILCVFLTYESLDTRNKVSSLYKHKIKEEQLKMGDKMPQVKKCKIEPLSILWENFHLENTHQFRKSVLVTFLLVLILFLALICLFLINVHATQLKETQSVAIDPEKTYSYQEVVESDSLDKLINFCSKLDYLSFDWDYYVLCLPYYESYQQRLFSMLMFSLLIVGINFILSQIVRVLSELRRYKTRTAKSRFLIFYVFIIYFVSAGLLILLIRADFDGVSLGRIVKAILPEGVGNFSIESYKDFNRKWYLQIGSQIIMNYAVSLVISPFFQILLSWLRVKYNFYLAARAKNQKQMNEALVDSEFDFEYFYAMTLNSVFFCLFYSNAMPVLYPLAILSLLSIYIASVIVFKHFSSKPQSFDHSLNASISKILLSALIIHQLTSIFYFYVQQIFPIDGDNHSSFLHKFREGIIYIVIGAILSISLFFHDRICHYAKMHWNKAYKEYINMNSSEFDRKTHQFSEIYANETKNSYLSSYALEDNPFYLNLSYTLSLLAMVTNRKKSYQNGNQPTTQVLPKTAMVRQMTEERQMQTSLVVNYKIIKGQIPLSERTFM